MRMEEAKLPQLVDRGSRTLVGDVQEDICCITVVTKKRLIATCNFERLLEMASIVGQGPFFVTEKT